MLPSLTALGEDEFTVNRHEARALLGRMDVLSREAFLTPHFSDGQLQGMRVRRLQPHGLLEQLGVQAGDVIRSVNGIDAADFAQLLPLLGRAHELNQVEFNLIRGEQTLRRRIQLR